MTANYYEVLGALEESVNKYRCFIFKGLLLHLYYQVSLILPMLEISASCGFFIQFVTFNVLLRIFHHIQKTSFFPPKKQTKMTLSHVLSLASAYIQKYLQTNKSWGKIQGFFNRSRFFSLNIQLHKARGRKCNITSFRGNTQITLQGYLTRVTTSQSETF